MIQPRHIQANGVRLNVVEHEGDGPTLVLAPGLTANDIIFP